MVARAEMHGGMAEIGDRKECPCREEPWVMSGIAKSLYCIHETNKALHVNGTGIKIKT